MLEMRSSFTQFVHSIADSCICPAYFEECVVLFPSQSVAYNCFFGV
jgi:hypothetical protein